MAGSGVEEILEAVFGGIGRMSNGKKFPLSKTALSLLIEEQLREIVSQDYISFN